MLTVFNDIVTWLFLHFLALTELAILIWLIVATGCSCRNIYNKYYRRK